MNRQDQLKAELKRMLAILRQDASVQLVLLFGSMVGGRVKDDSDLDLVVVRESDAPFFDRLNALRRQLQPRIAADLLVYTPAEWFRLKTDRPFIREEIAEKGKVLYERPRYAVA